MTETRSALWKSAVLISAALGMNLWGLNWLLPSADRLAEVLPAGMDTPAFRGYMEQSWKEMHRQLGSDLMVASEEITNLSGLQKIPAGWTTAPGPLINPIRSFYLRSAHDDEQTFLILFSKMHPLRLDFHPHMFLYGGGYLYPLGAWIAACSTAGIGKLTHSLSDYLGHLSWLAGLYLAGRLFSVAATVACVLLIFQIGRRYFTERTGFYGALVYALSPGVIIQSHVMKQHAYWSLYALLTFYLCCRVLESGRRTDYIAAGAAVGMATGSFSLAVTICLLVALAAGIRVRELPATWREEATGLAAAGVASAAVFFLVNPYWILDSRGLFAELAVQKGYSKLHWDGLFLFFYHPLRLALTAPVCAMVLFGAALAAARGDKYLWLCAGGFCILLAPSMISQAAFEDRGVRYCLPAIGLAGLLAAHAAESFRPRGGRLRGLYAAAVLLVFANLACEGAARAYDFYSDNTELSTHRQAGRWLESHLPPGTSLGLWENPRPANAPYFRLDRFRLYLMDPRAADTFTPLDLPEYVVVFNPAEFENPKALNVLRRYRSVKRFSAPALVPWIHIDSHETTANPEFEVYRLESDPAQAARNGGLQ